MIVIYAEKASLAKAIAVALKAGSRIAHPKEQVQCLHSQFTSGKLLTSNNSIPYQNKIGSGGSPVGHYEFIFNGEKTIICHGVGHLCGLADRTAYGEQYKNWDLDVFPCIPDSYQIAAKTDTKNCFDYVKDFFDKADLILKQKLRIQRFFSMSMAAHLRQYRTKIVPQMRRLFFRQNVQNERS